MLPVFQKIEANINHSFYVEQEKFQCFPNPLQFHPDIEILLVLEGTGTRFVGDSIDRFGPGDLVMIGQNVPHVWYSDEKYTKKENNLFSEVIYILFKTEIFGDQFWQLPESKCILKLIQLSQRGLKLTGKTREKVTSLVKTISCAVGFDRITLLLSILGTISSLKEYQFLASPVVQNTINETDSDRLNKVYKYVINNYHQEITLEKAASIASLSLPSFCRYFKKRTNKTFVKFLNEIRISYACRMLAEEDLPVARICYTCGYTNVSYFIKQFKEITGQTPLSYKKKYNNIT
ncbi:MAG: AraC family transcriptional regulator [Bacteroidales bacterium]|nr:AraC family transcriptional regulator [Bacteroidales bacterium]